MKMLDQPPAMRAVPLVSAYRPAAPRRPGMSQIEVPVTVDAPISVGLGALPLTIGLFAASGVSFLVGSQIPGARGITTVLGVLFAGGGVANLFLGAPSEAKAATTPPPSLPGGDDVVVSPPIEDTPEDAFALIEGRVISPTETSTVDISPIASSVPIRLRLTNPSNADASFDLVMDIQEQPEPFGDMMPSQESLRVDLGAGETRDYDVDLPLKTWEALTDYIEVDLTVRKRRISGGDAALLVSRFFVVE
jgi:hypothetical protein